MMEMEMEMDNVDEILSRVAQGGAMDYSSWPSVLPSVVARIERIAHTEFPIPKLQGPRPLARPPSPRFLAPLPSSPILDPRSTPVSQAPNMETAAASAESGPASSATAAVSLPKPIADMLGEILSVLRTSFSQNPPHTMQRLAELVLWPRQHYRNVVPYLHALDRVVHVTSGANTYPLPPALPDIGAISLQTNSSSGGGGGAGGLSIDTSMANNFGSDEALGGALLTPIPWLAKRTNGSGSEDGSDAGTSSPMSAGDSTAQQFQLQQQHQQRQGGHHLEGRVQTESTETIEGPHGMGSIETVSVSVNGVPSTGAGVALLTQRSVTQGELLRQEQRACVVPLNQTNRQQQQQQQQHRSQQHQQRDTPGAGTGTAGEDAIMTEDIGEGGDEEETPHARGPEEIGLADTGPQPAAAASYIAGGGPLGVQQIDLERAVGRKLQSPPPARQRDRKTAGDTVEEASVIIPQSPKREAPDALEPDTPRKRVKEADGAPGGQAPSASRGGNQPQEKEGNEESAPVPPPTTTEEQQEQQQQQQPPPPSSSSGGVSSSSSSSSHRPMNRADGREAPPHVQPSSVSITSAGGEADGAGPGQDPDAPAAAAAGSSIVPVPADAAAENHGG